MEQPAGAPTGPGRPVRGNDVSVADATVRGARSYATVDPERIRLLETGETCSGTHVEQMALDMGRLLASWDPTLGAHSGVLRGIGFLDRLRAGGRVLLEAGGDTLQRAAVSPSDTVRGWAAFAIGLEPSLALPGRLDRIQPFARDAHFAVREWAWLAVRPAVVADAPDALRLLQPWAENSDVNVRRFALEVTRPRSVWGAHCATLRQEPWRAEDLLAAAAEDRRRYVEDAVANWLNDARKDHPEWVTSVCRSWDHRYGSSVARLTRRAERRPLARAASVSEVTESTDPRQRPG